MELTLHLRGTDRPLLMRNGRLANPLDKYAQEIAKISKKRGKSTENLAELAILEARGSAWETEDGFLGIPNRAVWRAIYDAAKAFRKGEDIKRALIFQDVTPPLTIDGEKVLADQYVKDFDRNVLYTSVKVQKVRTMRARPMVRNWASVHTFDFNDSVLDLETLDPVFKRAGELVGLGDWRPTYGSFVVAEVITS